MRCRLKNIPLKTVMEFLKDIEKTDRLNESLEFIFKQALESLASPKVDCRLDIGREKPTISPLVQISQDQGEYLVTISYPGIWVREVSQESIFTSMSQICKTVGFPVFQRTTPEIVENDSTRAGYYAKVRSIKFKPASSSNRRRDSTLSIRAPGTVMEYDTIETENDIGSSIRIIDDVDAETDVGKLFGLRLMEKLTDMNIQYLKRNEGWKTEIYREVCDLNKVWMIKAGKIYFLKEIEKIIQEAVHTVNMFDQANTGGRIETMGDHGRILAEAANNLRKVLNQRLKRTMLTAEEAKPKY